METANQRKIRFHSPEKCRKCVYLGSGEQDGEKYDYYFCTGIDVTVISRYGEDGDYLSGLVFAFGHSDDILRPLRTAAILAMRWPELVDLMKKELSHYPEKYADLISVLKLNKIYQYTHNCLDDMDNQGLCHTCGSRIDV